MHTESQYDAYGFERLVLRPSDLVPSPQAGHCPARGLKEEITRSETEPRISSSAVFLKTLSVSASKLLVDNLIQGGCLFDHVLQAEVRFVAGAGGGALALAGGRV